MNDEPRLPALHSGGAIKAIVPTTFEEAWRIANAVVKAGMNPNGLGTPEKCTIVIMHGLEVGMPPMMALQSIALINGRPSIYGDGALGLVYASDKLETIKEWMEGTGDNRVAICTVKRRGDPEPKTRKFSVADAKKAKLWQKKGAQGQDTPWITYDERMLQMRARSWALRDGFADVLKGLAIEEEQRDAVDTPAPTPPKPPALGVEPPVSSVQTMPPLAPPRPPKTQSEIDVGIHNIGTEFERQVNDAVDRIEEEQTFGEEILTPGELLSELDDSLGAAKTAEEIEEIYNDYDLEARLQSMPQGEEFVGVAIGIKRRHLKLKQVANGQK